MNGSNISESFPRLFDEAINLNDALTPIFLVLSIVALIGKGMQCMNGDLRGMIGGITMIAIVSILIPTFPDIINRVQLTLHGIAQSAGANPAGSANEFANLIVGESGDEDTGFVDILFDSKGGLGKALTYFVISCFSLLALAIQYLYSFGQQFFFVFAVALSPIFFGFLLLKDTRGIAVNYFLGTFAITLWPIGFAISAIGTSSLLEAAAEAKIRSAYLPGVALETSQGIFFAAIISIWMFVSTVYTPKLIYQVITTGANAGGLLLQRASSAITLATAYGLIAKSSAQLSGASATRTAAATAIGGAGGVFSGATGGQAILLPAVVGVTAAKSSIGGKGGNPTDYNANADEIANRNK
ncbi:hypothetical protein N9891_00130 [bacterium]|nr:hypothetical protein [bacterium]